MTSVVASRLLTPAGWIGPARVDIDQGMITAISTDDSVTVERWLVPGFVDLQVNGIDDVDVANARGTDWDRLDRLLLAQGVTTWCPTLVSMPLHRYAEPLERLAEAMRRAGPRPTIAGVHLEGPFLGGAPGAHPPELIVPIDLEWLRALPPHVALVTLAAEQPLALDAIRLLTAAGRLVSIGHSTATERQFDEAVSAGARLTTHLFNGMSGVHHRSPGVAAFTLTNPHVSASLIADCVHVHPRMLQLAFRALGSDRAVLVTDSVAWRAGSAGSIGMTMLDGAPRLHDGTLAGSALDMRHAIANCVAAGIAPDDAIVAASTNPARLLGFDDRGHITPGARADLVALTPELEIEQVWLDGEPV